MTVNEKLNLSCFWHLFNYPLEQTGCFMTFLSPNQQLNLLIYLMLFIN